MALNSLFNFDPDQSDLISGVMNGIMSKIMDEIKQPLMSLVGEVANGKWKGKGAERFLAEMNGDMTSALDLSHSSIDQLKGQLGAIVGIMNQGQSAATGLANQIQGLFDSWS